MTSWKHGPVDVPEVAMPSRASLLVAISATVLLGVLTVAVVAHPGPLLGELGYIQWWQSFGGPVPGIADVVRQVTGTEAALLVGVLPALWLIRRDRRSAMVIVATALTAMLVVQPLAKEFVGRPRPNAAIVDVRAEHDSKSFPSGHAIGTTIVWGGAAAAAWRRGRIGLGVVLVTPVFLTVAASGIEGAHWPSDSIAGVLCGLLVIDLAAWLASMRRTSTTGANGAGRTQRGDV
jgi:undecaprenyl-diphosphatase